LWHKRRRKCFENPLNSADIRADAGFGLTPATTIN
jgi:hypothetical protein